MGARIVSTGSFVPPNIIRNEALTQFPQSAIPLIEQKTGVKQRCHANSDQCTSDLAIEAASRCLDAAGLSATELDAIILATSSPDRIQPATATRVQAKIGACNAFAFDINSVCSGGVYALHLADSLVRSASARRVLVLASEVYSRYLNPRDFSTYPYFGDGAGAVLLAADGTGPEIVKSILCADGSGCDVIQIPAGGTMLPFEKMSVRTEMFFRMAGKEVYQFAVTKGTEVIQNLLHAEGVSGEEVAVFVLHQANLNIIRKIADNLRLPQERFFVNLDRYGNTAAASVLIAFDEWRREHALAEGRYAVLAAFGGGLSWGANLIRAGHIDV